ncbi:hypothetical protein ACPVTF_12530 [Geobacillus icigianus]|uniref:Uncharacterized protein n=1 Tax=Geobacillus subterraneus TaxID=129338 RepID=A0A679FHM4_9BACL|nr:hypothetical protein [Geobacillus subterraneus]BBW95598.1 hypothetical protein GsuE55_04310 [Geobacillus subterraneus]
MNRRTTIAMALVILIGAAAFLSSVWERSRTAETIKFFPLDREAVFTEAKTSLTLNEKKQSGRYALRWATMSILNRPAYLRQDVSLLFVDGRLADVLSKWQTDTAALDMEKTVRTQDSRLFQAVSFHHAELHKNSDITSSQAMSSAYLYVIDSPYRPLASFRRPQTAAEREWQRVLNKAVNEFLRHKADELLAHFSLAKDDYYALYLPELVAYTEQPLPGLPPAKTEAMIGRLWDGLYKSYILGIKKEDGSILSPLGSTMPLILIRKDYRQILVLFEAQNGDKIMLIQAA